MVLHEITISANFRFVVRLYFTAAYVEFDVMAIIIYYSALLVSTRLPYTHYPVHT